MAISNEVRYTIYARQGEHGRADGSVGIHIPPTPSLGMSEVFALADKLCEIAKQMRKDQ